MATSKLDLFPHHTAKLEEVKHLALTLMDQYLPANTPYTFAWHDRVGHLGTCFYAPIYQICLSKRWTKQLTMEEIEDTIRHELAHARAGHKAGHGPQWRAECLITGAIPSTKAWGLSKGKADIATIRYELVDTSRTPHRIMKRYVRKPSAKFYASLPYRYALGRKEESLGKLVVRKVSDSTLKGL